MVAMGYSLESVHLVEVAVDGSCPLSDYPDDSYNYYFPSVTDHLYFWGDTSLEQGRRAMVSGVWKGLGFRIRYLLLFVTDAAVGILRTALRTILDTLRTTLRTVLP